MDKTSSADARNYTATPFEYRGRIQESKGKSITEESRFRNARLTLRFVKSSSNRYPLCSTMPQNGEELFVWPTVGFTWSRIQIDARNIEDSFSSFYNIMLLFTQISTQIGVPVCLLHSKKLSSTACRRRNKLYLLLTCDKTMNVEATKEESIF